MGPRYLLTQSLMSSWVFSRLLLGGPQAKVASGVQVGVVISHQ